MIAADLIGRMRSYPEANDLRVDLAAGVQQSLTVYRTLADVPNRVAPLTPQEASTAVYVDFESLGHQIDRPAILGTLLADDTGDRFQQFVLDPVLRGAVVARKGVCIDAKPEEAVSTVVEEAQRSSRVIVSWSMHESDVVRSTCSRELADRFCALHRNALDTTRPWKRNLYPSYAFVLLKRFGGKHPLKEYFRLIGYGVPEKLRPAAPAKWLKHVLQQMKGNDGHYRGITQEAKRDWYKLLLYNEHDCRGMRAVVVQAAHELALWTAYERTQFVVFENQREITFYAGYRNPKLDALLDRLGAARWAFLTASNPESIHLSEGVNDQRHQQLLDQVRTAGHSPLEGEGRDPVGRWTPERSLFVPGISRREAREIGRRFGQLAIVVGHRRFAARLVPCGLPADRSPGR